MRKEYLDLSDGQLRTYEALNNMRLKEIVMWCMLTAFFAILAFIFFGAKDTTFRITLATLDAIIGGTIYPIVSHYFPALKAAKHAEKNKKQSPTNAEKGRGKSIADSGSPN
jgi:hypothetical protein